MAARRPTRLRAHNLAPVRTGQAAPDAGPKTTPFYSVQGWDNGDSWKYDARAAWCGQFLQGLCHDGE